MQQVEPVEPSVNIGLDAVWGMLRAQRRTILALVAVAAAVAVAYNLLATRVYRSTAVIHLSLQAGQEMKSDRVVDVDQYTRWNRDRYVQTQLEILESRPLYREVLRRYEAAGFVDPLIEGGAEALAAQVRISARENSELVEIQVEHTEPESAAALANLVAEVYREHNLEGLRDSARDARIWLQQQIAEYQERTDRLSEELAAYMGDNDLADVEQRITSLTASLEALKKAHADVNTEVILQRSQVRAHDDLWKRGLYDELAKTLRTPVVDVLTSEVAHELTEHARLASRYGDRHPSRQQAEERLARVTKELQGEIAKTLASERARLEVLQQNQKNLMEEIEAGNQALLATQRRQDGYTKLRSELERSRALYQELRQRHDELELQARTQLNNVRVIDDARPEASPVRPRTLLNLAAALVAGLVIGVGVALVRELLDDSVDTPRELTSHVHLPYLGLVPKIPDESGGGGDALYTFDHPDSSAAEAMRAIRTLIDLTPKRDAIRTLLVTSALSAEGKTGTAVRLAVAFARLGRRVLLVDADLRRPRIHKVFEVPAAPGLGDALTGTPHHEVVRPSRVPNLELMTVGTDVHRSTEALASVAVDHLLADLAERYDLVVVDSPPVALVADAVMLSRTVDGVVFVVRGGVGSRRLIREAVSNLEKVGAPLVGVVLNAYDPRSSGGTYGYADQGYGYRYGPVRDADDPGQDDADESAAK